MVTALHLFGNHLTSLHFFPVIIFAGLTFSTRWQCAKIRKLKSKIECVRVTGAKRKMNGRDPCGFALASNWLEKQRVWFTPIG